MVVYDGSVRDGRMDFYQRAETVCKRIPYGRVATYGQIALLCGKPKNARQAGYALHKKMGEDVPCHRVVNAQGYLSGAGAFDVPGEQRMLLEAEGVEISRDGIVDLKKYGWHNTLEEALALKELFERTL